MKVQSEWDWHTAVLRQYAVAAELNVATISKLNFVPSLTL
jgi:hypothetical protein